MLYRQYPDMDLMYQEQAQITLDFFHPPEARQAASLAPERGQTGDKEAVK